MKKNQRTVKVYDSTHKTLAKLSARYDLSMAAIVDLMAAKLAADPTIHLTIPPKDSRYEKRNSKSVTIRTPNGESF